MAAFCDILNARRGWIWKIFLLIDLKDNKGWMLGEKHRLAFIELLHLMFTNKWYDTVGSQAIAGPVLHFMHENNFLLAEVRYAVLSSPFN